ncbi:MAG: ABC transporter permease [Lentisphaeria bacterium]
MADLIAELEHEFERRTKPKFSFIGLPEQVGERTVSLGLGMRSFFEFSGSLCRSLAYAVLHPRRVRWGDVLIYMDRCGIGGLPMSYWHQTTATLGAWDILQGLVKSVVFALFIAAVGCLRGLQTRGGAQGVGSSTTAAVVTGIFCIIISDAAMTMIFARLGLG